MSQRLSARLDQLRNERRAGFVPFIMAGDPSPDMTASLLMGLPEAGADIIELGMPFSDPMADGPIIQAAGLRALDAGTTLKTILRLVSDFRKGNDEIPIILMGYANPIYHYGIDGFMQDAATAGVDGLIIVDIPQEEIALIADTAGKAEIDIIRLIAPTSLENRLEPICKDATGFLYYISVKGITGSRKAKRTQLEDDIARIKSASSLPVAVGFGIKTPDDVAAVCEHADLIVVGSAIVDGMANQTAEETLAHVKRLSAAIRTDGG